MKDAINLLSDLLRAIGADGLCGDDCGCHLSDLAPCCAYFGSCEPAKRVKRSEAIFYGVNEPEPDCDYIMVPLDAPRQPSFQCDGCNNPFLEDDLFWTGTRRLCDLCRPNAGEGE